MQQISSLLRALQIEQTEKKWPSDLLFSALWLLTPFMSRVEGDKHQHVCFTRSECTSILTCSYGQTARSSAK